MEALVRILLCSFLPYYMFFMQDNPGRILSYQKKTTYRSARMVLYIKHVLFLLIDRLVCIIQNNHILDVLIKYIAN